jgi:hypothetical protein
MGMTMTMLIGGGLFVALLALLWLNVSHHEEERAKRGAALPEDGHRHEPGRCGLCEAPLRERRTVDEVVHEVEHRIDAELALIARRMAGGPDDAARLYRQ